jgi:L-ascorbate metabolism protein UlaG (beta-lactamase superfamily)
MSHKKEFQPYRYQGRFFNHAGEKHRSKLLPSIIMLFEWYWQLIKRGGCDSKAWFHPLKPIERTKNLLITWIGHSTFLIQVEGINIITDPIFGNLPFFKRQIQPGIELKKMPPIDFVLISHNHLDHMDAGSLTFFKSNPECTFLVPLGDKAWFEKRGFPRVREYTWWERETFSRGESILEFSFLPALHWSQRGLRDFNTSLWGSWMMSVGGHSIYFAGDTAYSGHFAAIAQEFPRITHALLPIGPCEPRKWLQETHINAEEAGQAFLDLKAEKLFPMHWGTFSFGTDFHEAPFERVVSWWRRQTLSLEKQLIVLKIGQRFEEQSPLQDIVSLVKPTQPRPDALN